MRTNSGQNTRNLRVDTAQMTATTYTDLMHGFVAREFGPLKYAAKLLARATDASPRTAEKYLAGEHAPNGEKLITLLANRPDLETEFLGLVNQRRAELRARSHKNLAKAEQILRGSASDQ